MPAEGVAVEGNKDYVSEVLRDKLKLSKRLRADDRFVKKQNTIFRLNLRLAQGLSVRRAEFRCFQILLGYCARVVDKSKNRE